MDSLHSLVLFYLKLSLFGVVIVIETKVAQNTLVFETVLEMSVFISAWVVMDSL